MIQMIAHKVATQISFLKENGESLLLKDLNLIKSEDL